MINCFHKNGFVKIREKDTNRIWSAIVGCVDGCGEVREIGEDGSMKILEPTNYGTVQNVKQYESKII